MNDNINNVENLANRRDFMKGAMGVLGAGILLGGDSVFGVESKNTSKNITKNRANLAERTLGDGLKVSALGLGCMGMSANHGVPPSEKEMIKLIQNAIELGVTYFDTAEIYGPHSNEILLGKALKPYRDKVIIGTKFGLYYPLGKQQQDSSRKAIFRAVDESLKRLNTDYIDLYTQHRVDLDTPIEEVAQTMKELIKMGKIRHYGLSEPNYKTIQKAHKIHPIASIQSHYSMMFREVEDNNVLKVCENLGIGFSAYSPLERGFLGGLMNENTTFHPTLDMRAKFPRFSKEALMENQKILKFIRGVAKSKKVGGKEASTAQIALAWLLAQKPFIMPIPETTKLAHLKENLGALEINFSQKELQEIDKALKSLPVFGERYPPNSDAARSVGL